MKKNLELGYLVISFFFLPMLLCTGWGDEPVKTGPVDFTLEPILSNGWVCYIRDGDLYLKSIEYGTFKIRTAKEASAAIQSPDIQVMGDSIFAAWVERGSSGNKLLFVLSKDRGKTLLKPVELATRTKAMWARVLVDREKLYIFEISPGKEPEIFINLSSDRGLTFKRIQLETEDLKSLYHPSPVIMDNTLFIFFFGIKDGKEHVGMMAYEIPTMKLRDSAVLRRAGNISFLESLKDKGRPMVIYKTMRDNRFVLEGFMKGDTDWEAFSIKGTEGLDVARMDFHVWEDGRILIVFSGEDRDKFKQRIYAAVSEDEGKNWNVSRIDKKEFDNTRAWLPRMAVDGNKVAVVWEDSRDIRSGIRLKLSPDRGKTWLERDIPVSDSKYYAFRPRISFTNGAFYVAWHQFMDDEKKIANLAIAKLRWDDFVKIASQKEKGISLRKKESLLRERVKAYWKGMIKKDLKTTYEIHDPFYKARIPFDYYSAHRGPMVYHSYNIEGLKIAGNEATVRIKVKYEVPKIIILGKETFMPSKEITAEDIFLFIDGIWYRKFVDAMSGGSAIDY